MLMCQGRYNEAKVLCDLLISATDNCEGNALLEPHKNIRLELAQIYASIVIETNNKSAIGDVLQRLEQDGNDAYSVFLKARIFWMEQKRFAALTLLENYFVVEIKDDKVEFRADSPYWQLNAGTKELVLNLLAHGYKFYGETSLASVLCLESFNVAEFFPTKVFEYCNYLFDAHYLFMSRKEYWQAHLKFDDLFKNVKKFKHKK